MWGEGRKRYQWGGRVGLKKIAQRAFFTFTCLPPLLFISNNKCRKRLWAHPMMSHPVQDLFWARVYLQMHPYLKMGAAFWRASKMLSKSTWREAYTSALCSWGESWANIEQVQAETSWKISKDLRVTINKDENYKGAAQIGVAWPKTPPDAILGLLPLQYNYHHYPNQNPYHTPPALPTTPIQVTP